MIERTELPVDALRLDPMQSRERAWRGDEPDQRLAKSIENDGLFHDVIVRPLDDMEVGDSVDTGVTTHTETDSETVVDGEQQREQPTDQAEYTIIAGSRRYYAAMEAGYETLPCKILQADDLDAAWTSLLENTDRRELSEQELAQQLNLIYQLIRPREHRGDDEDSTTPIALDLDIDQDHFETDEEALAYIAERYCGRSDQSAISHVEEHLQTAALPPVLQSLFKNPEERTVSERTALPL